MGALRPQLVVCVVARVEHLSYRRPRHKRSLAQALNGLNAWATTHNGPRRFERMGDHTQWAETWHSVWQWFERLGVGVPKA